MPTEVCVLYGDLNRTRRFGARFDREEAYLAAFKIERSVREPHVSRRYIHRYDKFALRVR